jgi:hypothetical protein
VEPFLEPVLQLADAMMARDASDMAAGASNGQLLQCFLGQLLCFMDLCTHPDAAVAVAASQCMAQLVRDGIGGDDACAGCSECSLLGKTTEGTTASAVVSCETVAWQFSTPCRNAGLIQVCHGSVSC